VTIGLELAPGSCSQTYIHTHTHTYIYIHIGQRPTFYRCATQPIAVVMSMNVHNYVSICVT